MNKNSNPIDYIIRCCEQGLVPSTFDILNAKDELKKLRDNKQPTNYSVIGWSRINSRGDVYDLSVCYNSYLNQDTVLPIYSNQVEYEAKIDKLSQQAF